MCTYDRAGTGLSEERPSGDHVTAALMAEELHRLLEALESKPPVVLVGHSYGGMPVRAFEGAYPDEVAGMVLIDVSSEPEVPVYERLDAGPWIDGSDKIDIHATVPELAARAQARLAGLSSNAFQVVAPDSGHLYTRTSPGS